MRDVKTATGALSVLFDFSLASDEAAGPRTVMQGLLRGWAEANPQDRLTVFGPLSLRSPSGAFDFEMVEARVQTRPRRILQQQIELPLRRLAGSADVVLVPNLTCSLVGIPAPIVGVLNDVRHLRRPQEFSRASRLFRGAVWAASARRMAAVISGSNFALSEAAELGLHLPKERAVIPHGLDHVSSNSHSGGKLNTVVCVGHRSSKGLLAVPAIWAAVQGELGAGSPELIITGVGRTQQADVLRAMGQAGVVDGFHLTEFLPVSQLHHTIATAKAVLYLSSYEGYGLIPSEATVLGTHSFVYDIPPYRERARDLSVTAVPVDDAVAVAGALVDYLRGGRFDVAATPVRRWADAALEYRAVIERVLRLPSRSTAPGTDGNS